MARFCASRSCTIRSDAAGCSALRAATYSTAPITPSDARLDTNSITITLDWMLIHDSPGRRRPACRAGCCGSGAGCSLERRAINRWGPGGLRDSGARRNAYPPKSRYKPVNV